MMLFNSFSKFRIQGPVRNCVIVARNSPTPGFSSTIAKLSRVEKYSAARNTLQSPIFSFRLAQNGQFISCDLSLKLEKSYIRWVLDSIVEECAYIPENNQKPV